MELKEWTSKEDKIILDNFPYKIEIIVYELQRKKYKRNKQEVIRRVVFLEKKAEKQRRQEEIELQKSKPAEIILPCRVKLSDRFGSKCWNDRCYLSATCPIYEKR